MDTMKTRNSYPLGKRLAENMCYSYFSEYQLPVKIARLSQDFNKIITTKKHKNRHKQHSTIIAIYIENTIIETSQKNFKPNHIQL